VGYTVITASVLLSTNAGNLLAILLVILLPGYAIVAALFPGSLATKNPEIDWIERIALSFGLSIAVVPLLGLLLSFTPSGIRFAPIVVTIALFTVGVGYAAYLRRMRLPPKQRLALTIHLGLPDWKEFSAFNKGLTITLVASIIVAAGTLAYIIASPGPAERFTELYILSSGGNASGYPTNLTLAERGTVIVGIINHEAATVAYAVQADLVGVVVVFNASCTCNETQEVNRTSFGWLNQSLDDSQKWSQPFTFWINATGLWKLQFRLYKDGILTTQELHLLIRVS